MGDKEKCMPGACSDKCSCSEEDADYLTLEFDDGQEVECELWAFSNTKARNTLL